MNKIDIEKGFEESAYKLLKKFAFMSRKFCDKYCVPDALMDIMKFKHYTSEVPKKVLYSTKLSYDYDYYAFTKSTKTLQAILLLLKDKQYIFNEDVMILVRSIFENHILSRYFREYIDSEGDRDKVINDFIQNPLGVSLGFFTKEGLNVKNHNGEKIGKISLPSNYKLGDEKEYYSEFYPFLCEFAHCSFGTIESYFDGGNFYFDKCSFRLEAIGFALFAFTKIYEGVVTVEGENYESEAVEKSYYDLAYDSLELQNDIFEYLIGKYESFAVNKDIAIISLYFDKENVSKRNLTMKSMLTKMKESLDDKEIGSVVKDKDENGKYKRRYPEY